MSDTPRTDALLLVINEGRTYETEGPETELCRQLERDLYEAENILSWISALLERNEPHKVTHFLSKEPQNLIPPRLRISERVAAEQEGK